MKKIASFWKKTNNKIQCILCPHHCLINEGMVGICGVRKNENGNLYSLIYGSSSSIAADPIEKKPLYHFYPGSHALSLGSVGCNFRCLHCQNYSISTADPQSSYLRELEPEQVLFKAKEHNCQGVAFTYNEPSIWHEFALDSSKIVKKDGLYTCYVTNGYINEDPLKEISNFLDAMNIDVKGFTESFYKKICKAKLQPVIDTCELANELDIHIELTYLVIPTYNDSLDEIERFCSWVCDKLGETVPVHFSRFHPDHNLQNIPPTTMKTMLDIYETAKKIGLYYIYLGNVSHGDYENTFCSKCGNLLIERQGFFVNFKNIDNNKCNKCDNPVLIVNDKYKKQKI